VLRVRGCSRSGRLRLRRHHHLQLALQQIKFARLQLLLLLQQVLLEDALVQLRLAQFLLATPQLLQNATWFNT